MTKKKIPNITKEFLKFLCPPLPKEKLTSAGREHNRNVIRDQFGNEALEILDKLEKEKQDSKN